MWQVVAPPVAAVIDSVVMRIVATLAATVLVASAMVGCSSETASGTRKSAVGENCTKTDDCSPNGVCKSLVCEARTCTKTDDCEGTAVCKGNECVEPTAAAEHSCEVMFKIEDKLYGAGVVCDWGGTCIDGGDEYPCICRGQDECGDGYACLRGAGCYCLCTEVGEPARPDCQDPTCENGTS